MVSFVPSGSTRVSRGASISTTITLPSGIATGPSGKCSPEAISLSWLIRAPSSSVWIKLVSDIRVKKCRTTPRLRSGHRPPYELVATHCLSTVMSTGLRRRLERPLVTLDGTDGTAVHDLVEVLGQAGPFEVAVAPAGHPFGDAGRLTVAPVA